MGFTDRKLKLLYIFIFISAVFTVCSGRASAQDVLLRYGHTAGTALNYDLIIDTPNAQGTKKISLVVTQDVDSIDTDGNMDVIYSFSNGGILTNGIPSPYPLSGEVLSSKISRRGEGIQTTAIGGFSALMGQAGIEDANNSPDIFRSLGILEFPVETISEGGAWSVSKSKTFPNGDIIDVTYTYTLENFVNYAGYDCAVIKIESHPNISFYKDFPTLRRGMQINGQVKVLGTLHFAYNEGKIINLSETVETNAVNMMLSYDGMSSVSPVYQKTSVSLKLK